MISRIQQYLETCADVTRAGFTWYHYEGPKFTLTQHGRDHMSLRRDSEVVMKPGDVFGIREDISGRHAQLVFRENQRSMHLLTKDRAQELIQKSTLV